MLSALSTMLLAGAATVDIDCKLLQKLKHNSLYSGLKCPINCFIVLEIFYEKA